MRFDGVWTPIVTPFDSNGLVDMVALAPLIDTLVDQGVSGLVVGGPYYCQPTQNELLAHVLAAGRDAGPFS